MAVWQQSLYRGPWSRPGVYCSLLGEISTFSEWVDGWMSAGMGDRYWARVLRPPRLLSPCGDVGAEGGWSTTWCLLLSFLFKVKRWHHRRGRGRVSEGESMRCFSSLLLVDTHILNLARSLYKCFPHCPMLHLLPWKSNNPSPKWLFQLNAVVVISRQFVQTICNILACDLHGNTSHREQQGRVCSWKTQRNQGKQASACHTQEPLLGI